MVVAFINFDIDRWWDVFASVLTSAMLCICYRPCLIVFIIGVEAHDGTLDILYSKGLLQCSGEPHAHSFVPEYHCWKSFCFLNAWYLECFFEGVMFCRALERS